MLQEFIGARRRAVSPVFVHAFALLGLAAGLVAAIPQAYGQAMQAAIGVYRPSVSKFFFDGNFDKLGRLEAFVRHARLDVGLLGDLAGAGNALIRSSTATALWYVDATRMPRSTRPSFSVAPPTT